MRPILIILLLVLWRISEAQPQSPYKFDIQTHISILGFSAFNYLITPETEPLSLQQINGLDKANINGFDRFAADNYSPALAKQSDVLLYGSFLIGGIIPVFYSGLKNNEFCFISESAKILSMYAGSFLLCYTGTNMMKANVLRIRPYVYNPAAAYDKFEPDARYSFFSGHSSHVAFNSFFAAKVFNDYYPDSKYKNLVWSIAAVLPAYTAFLRVAAGKHFVTDVLAGYGYGAFCGFFVPYIFNAKRSFNKQLSISPSLNGIGLTYQFR